MPGEEVHPSTEINSVTELLIGWGSATVYPPLDHSEAAAPIDEQLSGTKFAIVPAGYLWSFAEAEVSARNTRAGATGICADEVRRAREEAERFRELEERYGPDRLPNTEDDPNRVEGYRFHKHSSAAHRLAAGRRRGGRGPDVCWGARGRRGRT